MYCIPLMSLHWEGRLSPVLSTPIGSALLNLLKLVPSCACNSNLKPAFALNVYEAVCCGWIAGIKLGI